MTHTQDRVWLYSNWAYVKSDYKIQNKAESPLINNPNQGARRVLGAYLSVLGCGIIKTYEYGYTKHTKTNSPYT